MAFPATRRSDVERLTVGDRLLLLTTRGCWHNPTRNRIRVIGEAEVATQVHAYDEPVTVAGREFTRGCELRKLEGAAVVPEYLEKVGRAVTAQRKQAVGSGQ